MTVGPYRPIHLQTYTAHILDLNPKIRVSSELNPSLEVALTLRGNLAVIQAAQVVLKDLDGKVLKQEEVTLNYIKNHEEKSIIKWDLKKIVELWWPIGHGKQTMYTVEVVLTGEVKMFVPYKNISFLRLSSRFFLQNSFILDTQTKNVGFMDL